MDSNNELWPLNLTQIRKNKWKRPDKTDGHKHSRTLEVDVVAAGDVDDDVLQCIQERVQPAVNGDADVEPDNPLVEETELPALEHMVIRNDICDTCGAEYSLPVNDANLKKSTRLAAICARIGFTF